MNIAIISASIREGRETHKVSEELCRQLRKQENINPNLVDLKEYALPLFEALYSEENASEATRKLRRYLHQADAMVFVSPEYNGSYTAALKNMTDGFSKAHFSGKPIGVVSVSSGALGGMRAAQLMQQLVLALRGYPIPQMLLVPDVDQKFSDEGVLLDQAFSKNITSFLEQFLWFTEAITAKKQQEKALIS